MIKREMYMSRIRPFMGTELIKIMTGIRRCGKSIMLELIKQELAEFMELYKTIAPDESIQKCFQKYLLSGGMPYLANIQYADEPSMQYLHDLFNSVQLKDIVKRNKIRDMDLLERIIAYVKQSLAAI